MCKRRTRWRLWTRCSWREDRECRTLRQRRQRSYHARRACTGRGPLRRTTQRRRRLRGHVSEGRLWCVPRQLETAVEPVEEVDVPEGQTTQDVEPLAGW